MFQEVIDIIFEKFTGWYDTFLIMIPNILVSIVLILLSIILGKVVKSITKRVLKNTKISMTVTRLVANSFYFLIIILGLFLSLTILNLNKTVTSILAGIGIVGIALGFAFQDLATNYISGIIISFQRPFKRGDQLETNGFFGEVQRIDLRVTKIRTLDGLSVLIPNRKILENPILNYTETNDRRVDLDVGISYAEDLEKVKRITLDAINSIKGINKEKEIELFFKEFGDSSINFFVRFWVFDAKQKEFHRARSAAVMEIKKAFDKEGITIPFPIRTLDFGIKGGEKLSENIMINDIK